MSHAEFGPCDCGEVEVWSGAAEITADLETGQRIRHSQYQCRPVKPAPFRGRWIDWHRGHGCSKDDGLPRSPEGQAEIDAHAAAQREETKP